MYSILNLHYHMCIWVNDFIFTIISTPNVGSTNLVLFFVWRISNEVRDTVQSYGSVPSKTRPGPVDRLIGWSSMDWCGRTGLQDSCGEKPSEIGKSFPKADCLQISSWLSLPRNTTLNQKVWKFWFKTHWQCRNIKMSSDSNTKSRLQIANKAIGWSTWLDTSKTF